MSLRPIGNRLIVRPEPAATQSDGGIIFPETHGAPPAMTGTVISVGRGPATAHRVRQATLARVLALIPEVAERSSTTTFRRELEAAITGIALEDVRASDIAEGDYVAFAYTSGANLSMDGDPYVVLNEDDVQAVWQADEKEARV